MDRGVLDKQLQALGESSAWWEQRELRDLPAVLHEDEEIRAIARGTFGRVRVPGFSWLLVVTERRLVALHSGRNSWRQIEIPAHHITSVTLRNRLWSGRVLVRTSDRTYRFALPHIDAQKLSSGLVAVAKCGQDTLSGPTHMVRRVVNHVLALPSAAFNAPVPARRDPQPAAPTDVHADPRYQQLEDYVHELQEQVKFLEQLLQQRQGVPPERRLEERGLADRAASGRY